MIPLVPWLMFGLVSNPSGPCGDAPGGWRWSAVFLALAGGRPFIW